MSCASMGEERHRWLCAYVVAHPRKGVTAVADAAEYHRGWIVEKDEIRRARIAAGLPSKVRRARRQIPSP